MAVYAAHLTRTLQGKPSVFQVTAQEALGFTIKPAFKKVLDYLNELYPNKLAWPVRWYDELFLLLDGLVQYHYLKHYAGSFSESFYGLLRVPYASTSEFSSGTRLPPALETGSLLMLVLLPYVRDKLERVVEQWKDDEESGALGKTTPDRLRKAAIRVYSICHFTFESLRLIQTLQYLRGAAPAQTLELRLLGAALREAPADTLPEAGEKDWPDVWRALLKGDLYGALPPFPLIGGAVLTAAQYGAFVLQALRWGAARGSPTSTALPPPEPPKIDASAERYKNKCPICLQSWKIPTVLPVSGYVFCYACISRHIRERGTCPVTSLPASAERLVRMYRA